MDYLNARYNEVVKSNDLIQRSKFYLTVQEMRLILYLVSKIDRYDTEFKPVELSILDYCNVCGINRGGTSYKEIKRELKSLADKSIFININGVDTLIRWLSDVELSQKTGFITVKFYEKMKPYLLQLKENYTMYELIWAIQFKSKYSIRLYELIKSLHYDELKPYEYTYKLDKLKELMGVEQGNYTEFKEFKRRVLDTAVDEINSYSEKLLSYELIKNGRNVVAVKLKISSKSAVEIAQLRSEVENKLNHGQMNIFQLESVNDEK